MQFQTPSRTSPTYLQIFKSMVTAIIHVHIALHFLLFYKYAHLTYYVTSLLEKWEKIEHTDFSICSELTNKHVPSLPQNIPSTFPFTFLPMFYNFTVNFISFFLLQIPSCDIWQHIKKILFLLLITNKETIRNPKYCD